MNHLMVHLPKIDILSSFTRDIWLGVLGFCDLKKKKIYIYIYIYIIIFFFFLYYIIDRFIDIYFICFNFIFCLKNNSMITVCNFTKM